MEKLKLAKLISTESAIRELTTQKMPFEYTEKLLDFTDTVSPYVFTFKEKANDMFTNKYAKKSEEGMWELIPETEQEYKDEIQKLLQEEIEVQVPEFSVTKIKETNPDFSISMMAYMNLKNFILHD